MKPGSYIFVYGTLRRKSGHPKAKRLRERACFVGEATITARLYDLGPYPGVVAAEGEVVRGDLFQMPDAEALLKILDEYEDAATGNKQLFKRELTQARLADGQTREAWVYWYFGDVSKARRIDSGEYG